MKRVRQEFPEISDSLSLLEVNWMDDPHAAEVISTLRNLPRKTNYTEQDVIDLLEANFRVGSTAIRLFLDCSADEYRRVMAGIFEGGGGAGVERFKRDTADYVARLVKLGLLEKMAEEVNRPFEWSSRLIGLFEGGWGSARKGQMRGRLLEDFVEEILKKIFLSSQIVPRRQFLGATGLSSEKADFAVPSAEDPHIIIEAKAFNATGSKQTDVLGDINKIVEQKRNDTAFLLVTDGISWKARASDLKKIIALQHTGKIWKIYTMAMAAELEADLQSLKSFYDI